MGCVGYVWWAAAAASAAAAAAAFEPHLLEGALVVDTLGVQHGIQVHINEVVEVLQQHKATQGQVGTTATHAGSHWLVLLLDAAPVCTHVLATRQQTLPLVPAPLHNT
jgi:hypothetical protein